MTVPLAAVARSRVAVLAPVGDAASPSVAVTLDFAHAAFSKAVDYVARLVAAASDI